MAVGSRLVAHGSWLMAHSSYAPQLDQQSPLCLSHVTSRSCFRHTVLGDRGRDSPARIPQPWRFAALRYAGTSRGFGAGLRNLGGVGRSSAPPSVLSAAQHPPRLLGVRPRVPALGHAAFCPQTAVASVSIHLPAPTPSPYVHVGAAAPPPRLLGSSAPQLLNSSAPQLLSSSAPQLLSGFPLHRAARPGRLV